MPALALAEALREMAPAVELLFFSGAKPQEAEWLRNAGAENVVLSAAPLGRSPARVARGLLKAWKGFRQAREALRRFRPHCLVGLGGYVSGPSALAASRAGIPLVIHEQNAVAGRTNRWLAGRAARIAATFPDSFPGVAESRISLTGNPIRRAILRGSKAQACEHFHLDPSRPTLLVSGGSQGARNLNEALSRALGAGSILEGPPWQILWIAGAANYGAVNETLARSPGVDHVRLHPFLDEMGLAYAAASAVLCRAGSGSLWEAAAWGLPMIAVPLPSSADDHQRRNARFFEEAGACIILEESQAQDAMQLMRAIRPTLFDEERRASMQQAARRLSRPDADRALARIVLEAAGHSVAMDRREERHPE